MSLHQSDLALILDAAREAGALALKLRREGLTTEYKPGDSPVTNADLATDALLTERLRTARPDYGWLSEETADNTDRLATTRTFVVDPIDGTRSFLKDKPWWSVCIAVVEAGRPTAAVVFAPDVDEAYAAMDGAGATLNGRSITASDRTVLEDCAMVGDQAMFDHPAWPTPWPPMRVASRNSTAYRMCLVAGGTFDATTTLAPKADWDLAAADLIATEAGAKCCDHKGLGFTYNRATPQQPSLVCAGHGLAPLILDRTSPIDLRR
jgi:myo-inositol-1(or 4)-monophosphatase